MKSRLAPSLPVVGNKILVTASRATVSLLDVDFASRFANRSLDFDFRASGIDHFPDHGVRFTKDEYRYR